METLAMDGIGSWFVGSDPGCELHVPFPGVAEQHAKLTFDGRDLWVEPVAGRLYVSGSDPRRWIERERVGEGLCLQLNREVSLGFTDRLLQWEDEGAEALPSDIFDALNAAASRRHRPASHVVLPAPEGLTTYALDGSPRTMGTLPEWANIETLSIDGDRAVTLQTAASGAQGIYVFDLNTGEHVGTLGMPPGFRGKCVLLVGGFLFAGGTALIWTVLGADRPWAALVLPDKIQKMQKGIDYLGVASGMLWAIDDIVYPLYAARYDLSNPAFPHLPAVLALGSSPNGHVYGFTCNDSACVTATDLQSGWVGYNRFVTVSKPETMSVVSVPACEQNWRGPTPPGIPLDIAVVGSFVAVARGTEGVSIFRVGENESVATVPPRSGGSIVGVVAAEPDRLFALERTQGVSWFAVELP